MRAPKTLAAAVALTAVTGLSLAACGSSSNNSSSSPSSSAAASAPAKPAVQAASLSGVHTQVALDPGFLTAITGLGLKPGVFGTATLTGTTLTFPITSGNVTYYAPGTQPAGQPYVQGLINHNGSGITLTAGSTVVTLENFVVNPGTSMLSGEVLLNGKVAAPAGTELFFLDGSTLKPATQDSAGDYVLTGTKVELAPGAAMLLGTAFNAAGKVPANLLVGIATITVK